MGLSAHLLESKAAEYRDEVGREEYRQEVDLLDTLPERFERRAWSWDDLETIVNWKSPRAMANFRSNEKATVNEALEEALTADSVIGAVQTLRSIAGVQVPMASAFLLFIDPDAYTVIDQKAWTVLREFGYVSAELDNHSTEQYLLYLGTCRSLATEYDIGLRDLDRALWVIGGEL